MRLKDTGFLRVRLSWLEFLDFRHSLDHFISCEWLSTKQYFRSFSALRHKHELLSCILRAFLSLCLILICAPVILVRWLVSQCCVVKDVVHLCTIHNPHDFLSFEGCDSFYEISYTVLWTVTDSIFITLEPIWFLTFDLNFTYCLYWSICCSLSLSVSVLDIHIGCLVYLRVTIMWHTTMTVNHG